MSLDNLAIVMRELGQLENALTSNLKAVSLFREITHDRPDAFTPDLARSLINLAVMQSALGKHESSLAAAQEAASLYHELARQRPEVFIPDLANSLIVLALQNYHLSDIAKALELAHNALKTLRAPFVASPHAHKGLMAPILRDYLHLCEDANQEPDHGLLAEITPYFSPPSEPKD